MQIIHIAYLAACVTSVIAADTCPRGDDLPEGEIMCGLTCNCGDPCSPTGEQECNITGGNPAAQEEFPWQVSISYSGRSYKNGDGGHICGGLLVNREWVVTAAHCFKDEYNKDREQNGLRIYTGAGFRIDTPDGFNTTRKLFGAGVHNVKDIIRHPDYKSTSKSGGDVALVKLDPPVTYPESVLKNTDRSTYVRPACLPQERQNAAGNTKAAGNTGKPKLNMFQCILRFLRCTLFGPCEADKEAEGPASAGITADIEATGSCHVSGYGSNYNIYDEDSDSDMLQRTLQKLALGERQNFRSSADCKATGYNTKDIVCAEANQKGANEVSDACGGDSGGPLSCMVSPRCHVERMHVWGIVRGGKHCNQEAEHRFGAYTNMEFYRDWIKDNSKIDGANAVQFA